MEKRLGWFDRVEGWDGVVVSIVIFGLVAVVDANVVVVCDGVVVERFAVGVVVVITVIQEKPEMIVVSLGEAGRVVAGDGVVVVVVVGDVNIVVICDGMVMERFTVGSIVSVWVVCVKLGISVVSLSKVGRVVGGNVVPSLKIIIGPGVVKEVNVVAFCDGEVVVRFAVGSTVVVDAAGVELEIVSVVSLSKVGRVVGGNGVVASLEIIIGPGIVIDVNVVIALDGVVVEGFTVGSTVVIVAIGVELDTSDESLSEVGRVNGGIDVVASLGIIIGPGVVIDVNVVLIPNGVIVEGFTVGNTVVIVAIGVELDTRVVSLSEVGRVNGGIDVVASLEIIIGPGIVIDVNVVIALDGVVVEGFTVGSTVVIVAIGVELDTSDESLSEVGRVVGGIDVVASLGIIIGPGVVIDVNVVLIPNGVIVEGFTVGNTVVIVAIGVELDTRVVSLSEVGRVVGGIDVVASLETIIGPGVVIDVNVVFTPNGVIVEGFTVGSTVVIDAIRVELDTSVVSLSEVGRVVGGIDVVASLEIIIGRGIVIDVNVVIALDGVVVEGFTVGSTVVIVAIGVELDTSDESLSEVGRVNGGIDVVASLEIIIGPGVVIDVNVVLIPDGVIVEGFTVGNTVVIVAIGVELDTRVVSLSEVGRVVGGIDVVASLETIIGPGVVIDVNVVFTPNGVIVEGFTVGSTVVIDAIRVELDTSVVSLNEVGRVVGGIDVVASLEIIIGPGVVIDVNVVFTPNGVIVEGFTVGIIVVIDAIGVELEINVVSLSEVGRLVGGNDVVVVSLEIIIGPGVVVEVNVVAICDGVVVDGFTVGSTVVIDAAGVELEIVSVVSLSKVGRVVGGNGVVA